MASAPRVVATVDEGTFSTIIVLATACVTAGAPKLQSSINVRFSSVSK